MASDLADRMVVPSWDGNQDKWEEFKEAVEMWTLAEDLERSYSVAARLVMRLTGPAKTVVKSMTGDQLHPTLADDPIEGELTADWRSRRNRTGIQNVMRLLQEKLGITRPTLRGERLEEFFQTRRYHRKLGERISDWSVRFEEALQRLSEVEVKLETIPDVCGWFYLSRAGLSPERRERVIAALPDEHFRLEALKPIMTRFFADLHIVERARSTATQAHRPRFQPRPHHRGTNVAEEDDEEEEEEEAPEEPPDLATQVQNELEALTADMEQTADDLDNTLSPEEAEQLEAAASDLAALPEAFAAVRNAREKLQRGIAKGKGKDKKDRPAVASKGRGGGRRPGKGGARGSARSSTQKIAERKAKTTCFDCGERGHWMGDPACKKPGAALLSPGTVNIADTGLSEGDGASEEEHEVQVVSRVSAASAPEVLAAASINKDLDYNVAVQDTACRFSVAGRIWYEAYLKKLDGLGLRGEAKERPEHESYRFGNGGTLLSSIRATVPAVLGNTPMLISFSVVDSPSLGLLLGRDFLTPAGVVLDMGNRTFRFGQRGDSVKMVTTRAGHYGMELLPERWRSLWRAAGRSFSHQAFTAEPVKPAVSKPVSPPSLRQTFSAAVQRPVPAAPKRVRRKIRIAPIRALMRGISTALLCLTASAARPATQQRQTELKAQPRPVSACVCDCCPVELPTAAVTETGFEEQTAMACNDCGEPTDKQCRDCDQAVCGKCVRDGCCISCFSGFSPDVRALNLTAERQHETHEVVKKGQLMQLSAGARTARTMQRHGLRPHAIEKHVSWNRHRGRSGQLKKPLLIEWCCSDTSLLSDVWQRLGGESLRLGVPKFDLSDRSVVKGAAAHAEQSLILGRAVRLHASFPCSAWCPIHRTRIPANGRPPTSKQRIYNNTVLTNRGKSIRMLRLFIEHFRPLLRRYPALFGMTFEWPRLSDGWNPSINPAIVDILRLAPFRFDFDGCQYGVASQKPWRIQSTRPAIPALLDSRCPGKGCFHQYLYGQNLRQTGFYGTRLAWEIACYHRLSKRLPNARPSTDTKFWQQRLGPRPTLLRTELHTDTGITTFNVFSDRLHVIVPHGPRWSKVKQVIVRTQTGSIVFAAGVLSKRHVYVVGLKATTADADAPIDDKVLSQAIRQLHVNMGHPPNVQLARAIRVSGGSEQAIKKALNWYCELCASHAAPGTTIPAKLAKDREFNDTIAVDLFFIRDRRDNPASFLSIVDLASRFHVVVRVKSKRPDVTWTKLLRHWILPFGVPLRVVHDGGGEFEREFGQELEDMGTQLLGTSALSPWQNGVAERHGGMWKRTFKKMIDEKSILLTDKPRVSWAMASTTWACNTAIGPSGYSPSQWVLGRSIRLPYNLLDQMGQLSLHERIAEEPQFAERLSLMKAAQRAIVAARYDKQISKAMLARSRGSGADPVTATYRTGDAVYYWRHNAKAGSKHRERWFGPATVVGIQGNQLWLAHRAAVVKCSREHVRHAQPSELVGWNSLLDDFAKRVGPNPTAGQDEGGVQDSGAPGQRSQTSQKSQTNGPMDDDVGGQASGHDTTQPMQDDADADGLPPGSTANIFVQPRTGERLIQQPDDRVWRNPHDPMYKRARYDQPGITPDTPQQRARTPQATPQPKRRNTTTTAPPEPQSQQEPAQPAEQPAAESTVQHDLTVDDSPPTRRDDPGTQQRRRQQLLDDVPLSIRSQRQPPGDARARRREALKDDLPTSLRQAFDQRRGGRSRSPQGRAQPAEDTTMPLALTDDRAQPTVRDLDYDDTQERPSPARTRARQADTLESTLEHAFNDALECGVILRPLRSDRRLPKASKRSGQHKSTFLVGRARNKEVDWKTLKPSQLESVKRAVAVEWGKWTENSATKFLSETGLKAIMRKNPQQQIVGTRWVITAPKPGATDKGYRARLVVQGCQEKATSLRTDSPTGSRDALLLTIAAASQKGWSWLLADAQGAYLQSGDIERLLLLRLPSGLVCPGTVPNQVVIASGAIYGTRDAGRQWYEYSKAAFLRRGWRESKLEKGFYILQLPGQAPSAYMHTHVDDCFIAYNTHCARTADIISQMAAELRMTLNKELDGVYCGRRIHQTSDAIIVDQAKAAASVENVEFTSRSAPLNQVEKTSYRGVLGQLLWLACQTRPDLAASVSMLARHAQDPTPEHARELNKVAAQARSTSGRHLKFPRDMIDLKACTLVTWADSSFANIDDIHSQFGLLIGATHRAEEVVAGDFSQCLLLGWGSGKVRRVVRSTLAAEGYATTEGIETTWWHRYLMAEMVDPTLPLKSVEVAAAKRRSLVLSDSASIVSTAKSDKGGGNTDKRFKIVVAMLREAVAKGQGVELRWVPTWSMVADPLTKVMEATPLLALMAASRHTFRKPAPKRASDVLAILAALPALAAASSGEQQDDDEGSWAFSIFVGLCFLVIYAVGMQVGRVSRSISRPFRPRSTEIGCQASEPRQDASTQTSTRFHDESSQTIATTTDASAQAGTTLRDVSITSSLHGSPAKAARPTTVSMQTQSQVTYSSVRGVAHPRFEVTKLDGAYRL